MRIKIDKKLDNYLMGKKIIEAGIKLDEGIADLLKFQVRALNELIKNESTIDEIHKANILLRDIIIAGKSVNQKRFKFREQVYSTFATASDSSLTKKISSWKGM